MPEACEGHRNSPRIPTGSAQPHFVASSILHTSQPIIRGAACMHQSAKCERYSASLHPALATKPRLRIPTTSIPGSFHPFGRDQGCSSFCLTNPRFTMLCHESLMSGVMRHMWPPTKAPQVQTSAPPQLQMLYRMGLPVMRSACPMRAYAARTSAPGGK